MYFLDLPGNILLALAVNISIALISFKAKLVDITGVMAGLAAGVFVFIGLGHQGFIILFTFFLLGSLASKFKMKTKEKMGLAQKKGGQRGWLHVLANCSIATACALCIMIFPSANRLLFFVAAVAALATALGDTISTELGQLYGRRAFLLISLKKVKPGTEGAVSAEGTVFGFAASIGIALLALAFHPFEGYGFDAVIVVSLAAMTANMIESVIGGFYHKYGKESPETLLNFANTLFGAALAAVWFL